MGERAAGSIRQVPRNYWLSQRQLERHFGIYSHHATGAPQATTVQGLLTSLIWPLLMQDCATEETSIYMRDMYVGVELETETELSMHQLLFDSPRLERGMPSLEVD